MLNGTLILADRSAQNIHLAQVSVSLWNLFNSGAMEMRLHSNIPLHNVEILFGNKFNKIKNP